MAGRYRALLIGNSTYPADEHNLQTLKGPVKDIAALNRALIAPETGLFADVDVALLPRPPPAGSSGPWAGSSAPRLATMSCSSASAATASSTRTGGCTLACRTPNRPTCCPPP